MRRRSVTAVVARSAVRAVVRAWALRRALQLRQSPSSRCARVSDDVVAPLPPPVERRVPTPVCWVNYCSDTLRTAFLTCASDPAYPLAVSSRRTFLCLSPRFLFVSHALLVFRPGSHAQPDAGSTLPVVPARRDLGTAGVLPQERRRLLFSLSSSAVGDGRAIRSSYGLAMSSIELLLSAARTAWLPPPSASFSCLKRSEPPVCSPRSSLPAGAFDLALQSVSKHAKKEKGREGEVDGRGLVLHVKRTRSLFSSSLLLALSAHGPPRPLLA